jgi:hypothetical protein
MRIASLAAGLLLATTALSAQKLAPADAEEFLGVWSLTLQSSQGVFEQTLTVKDQAGVVVAEITSQVQPEGQAITSVTKATGNLVLKFSGNYQGNAYDAAVTITPDGADKATVIFDVNGGQFTMSGTGARVKKAAGVS